MRRLEYAALAAALLLAGSARAQAVGNVPPAGPPGGPMPELRGPDELTNEFNRMRDKVDGRTGPTRSSRPVPATPGDITAGSEVRDSKGVVMGSIASVGPGFAVVASPLGKVEVEFASFAKNNKGLLINMPKAKFDAIVAGKPSQ